MMTRFYGLSNSFTVVSSRLKGGKKGYVQWKPVNGEKNSISSTDVSLVG